jgi:cytochrome c biogenesis protein CcmG/thiol:disulfide interchange protein DsbE
MRLPTMRLPYVIPIGLFLLLAVAFAVGLGHRPDIIPSPLIDKEAPSFTLPPLAGRDDGGLSSADLKGDGPVIVNVFASWCVPCRAEHPQLMALAREPGVRLVAINYKDKPQDAATWLAELGNPFSKIGADTNGRVAIDWGVYGVPETFILDKTGRIRFKQVGPITPDDLNEKILPVLRRLKG